MVRKADQPQFASDAFAVSLKLLQRAAQTEAGLRQKLSRRGFEDAVIDATVAKLQKLHFIDDQKFAHDYVAYRSRTSPLGRYHLKAKLLQKGIAKELAKQVTDTISAEEELALARTLATKRQRTLMRFEPEDRKQKLARFLAARGFSSPTVYAIIGEM